MHMDRTFICEPQGEKENQEAEILKLEVHEK